MSTKCGSIRTMPPPNQSRPLLFTLCLLMGCAAMDPLTTGPQSTRWEIHALEASEEDEAQAITRALPSVALSIEPLKLLSRRYRRALVDIHQPLDPTDGDSAWVLTGSLENGLPLSITYHPPGGFPLPIDQGAPIYIRALEETDGTRGEGRALLARAEDGRLLAALSDNMILPSNAMMDGFLVSPADTLTYSEVRRPDGICEVVREHTEVKISFGGTAAQLETGKWMRLFHEDNIYRVLAIESYTEVENNCDTPGRSAFGFAVLAMD